MMTTSGMGMTCQWTELDGRVSGREEGLETSLARLPTRQLATTPVCIPWKGSSSPGYTENRQAGYQQINDWAIADRPRSGRSIATRRAHWNTCACPNDMFAKWTRTDVRLLSKDPVIRSTQATMLVLQYVAEQTFSTRVSAKAS